MQLHQGNIFCVNPSAMERNKIHGGPPQIVFIHRMLQYARKSSKKTLPTFSVIVYSGTWDGCRAQPVLHRSVQHSGGDREDINKAKPNNGNDEEHSAATAYRAQWKVLMNRVNRAEWKERFGLVR